MDYLKLAGAGVVTIGAATAYYFLQGPDPPEHIMELSHQAKLLNSTDGARVSKLCENGQLVESYFDDVTTVYEGFNRGVRVSGDSKCLGRKPDSTTPFQWLTYNEVFDRATKFGAGLVALGNSASNETFIGIYSQNRPEYTIADQGMFRHSMVTVPLYDTLGTEACVFIVNQANLATIICDTNDKVKKLLDRRKETPCLETIILIETISPESKEMAEKEGIKIMQAHEVEKLGEENPVNPTPPSPSDICMVCYTSGTTGTPKGVMLSHRNIVSSVSAALKQLDACGISLNPEDRLISYLPLAHSYERALESVFLMCGGEIGYFQGDVRKLMDDIKELQPTIFPSVPRLLNRFYDKVSTGVNASRIKKMLFNMAMNSKMKELKKGIIRNNSIWDKIAFRTVQAALGGRVRAITTGSAPLSASVLTFLRCIVGCPIFEGYGQTENAGISTLTLLGDSEAGHVGPPLPCNMIKLDDVPEMEYYSNNNKGEICLKGPNVFMGYLKDKEKTEETLDKDGWLHTGDIGEWLPSGALKIIDRKKHIFKLAQGEYIAPEKIENIMVQCPTVAQVYVHGDSLQSFLVGVVVPDPETFPGYADKMGVKGTLAEMCKNENIKKAILKDLTDLAKKNGLSSLEQMKDIHLFPELFSVENGLLTPTFKSKRNDLRKYFVDEIALMYERTNAALSSKAS